ncbi:hypothetical protein SAMN02745163_00207 [Clostridium cavendishii DSM 21758]|uniref:Uncharacterized protein n=1 Tax=Clostridium cavendishii DSM 21758 TaxID=1121302 RepID=A0A1M6AY04_9CLOT|nr:hypothetical protein [Clostridium cavendishii]SHI41337.1 hypothetical protein SAMN02745163_00207 [Clostridium cavendishii DSM 21758]
MEIGEKILVKKDNLEKIQVKLKGLKVSIEDMEVKGAINEILEILYNELEVKETSVKQTSVKELISEKMNATKFLDPDLNFKLYMLYRKLDENKITDEEALNVYNLYTVNSNEYIY